MAVKAAAGSLLERFRTIEDPRLTRSRRHTLLDILAIGVCATICGAEGFTDYEDYGRAKQEWLKTFLELPNGIPSHDTFRRVFGMLNPKTLEACFVAWTTEIAACLSGQHVAIDGKTVRGSRDERNGTPALHVVSAWAAEQRLVLAQSSSGGAASGHGNEYEQIPVLLEMLVLKGAIVTIDAAGAYVPIVKAITDGGGEYLIALKQNQPTLHAEAVAAIAAMRAGERPRLAQGYDQQVDKGHGRIEIRRCYVIESATARSDEWPKLRSYVLVESERHIGESVTVEQRYYLTSLAAEPRVINRLIRAHWGIENSVHWVLDVVMGEDASRVRVDRAPKNLALLRKSVLNLLRRETSSKRGIKGKQKNAAWDHAYLLKILTKLDA